jgi:hypothetical protein
MGFIVVKAICNVFSKSRIVGVRGRRAVLPPCRQHSPENRWALKGFLAIDIASSSFAGRPQARFYSLMIEVHPRRTVASLRSDPQGIDNLQLGICGAVMCHALAPQTQSPTSLLGHRPACRHEG